jgi:hypothetical protein
MTDPEVNDLLAQIEIALPHGRSRRLSEVVAGWGQHVQRLQAERYVNIETAPDVWGIHDYIAALHLRDLVNIGLDQSPLEMRSMAMVIITDADNAFKSFTEPDRRGAIEQFSGERHESEAWWWKRLPQSGPVRDELRAIGISGS